MVNYICIKCNKIFLLRGDYLRHINKKKPCIIENNITINNNNLFTTEILLYNDNNQTVIIGEDKNNNQCEYCGKDYTRKDNLMRHIIRHCKKIKEQNQIIKKNNEIQKEQEIYTMKEKIKQFEIILESLQKNPNNITNIINNNNNILQQNVNININAHGKEDLSHITFNDYKQIFSKCNSCLPAFIELKHFNKDKPENSNVYISNLNSKHAFVYDGKQWNVKDKDEVVQNLYDNNCGYLIEKFEDLKDKLDAITLKKFMRFINKYEKEELLNGADKDIRLVLYNNRHIPIELRKNKKKIIKNI
jgi:hypothetical protein